MRPLQSFGFKESRYERPNQKWVCGRAAEGQPSCPLGPDTRGRCQASSECKPMRKGDRWFCARPASAGGPCSDGPLPDGACSRPLACCQPMRSLRARRGLLTGWTVALTFGVIIFLFGGPARLRSRVASPGHLTSHHSMKELTCERCHAVLSGPGIAGIAAETALDTRHPTLGTQDGRLCLNCHQLGPAPFQPHGLPPDKRAALTRKSQTDDPDARPVLLSLSSLLLGWPAQGHVQLECAACHQEHRGKDYNLSQLSNDQCQTCHARQFHSFAHGHPTFKQFPFFRPTRVLYDHLKHAEAHFNDTNFPNLAPAYCTDCHQTDTAGRTMLVTNFAAACAACHLRQIREAPGVAFLGIPNLAVTALRQRIGRWPDNGAGQLTPFTQLLLSADGSAAEAMRTLSGADLLDNLDELDRATTNELKAAEQLAWAIKELMADLAADATATLSNRLRTLLGRQLAPLEAARLAGQLPQDTLALAQAQWFPDLQQELSLHRSSKPLALAEGETNAASATRHQALDTSSLPLFSQNSFGWYRTNCQILYRPAAHADEFFRSWLDLSVSASLRGAQDPISPDAFASLRRLSNAIAKPESPGRCAKCHSTEIKPPLTPSPLAPREVAGMKADAINWHPFRPEPDQHTFTKFSHQAHFSLIGSNGCVTCHGFKRPAETNLASVGTPASPSVPTPISNFAPVQKDVCARCHTGQQAGDSCLQCHDYHIGKFKPTLPLPAQNLKMTTAQVK